MQKLFLLWYLLVPLSVHGAEYKFDGFGDPLDLPFEWENTFNRTLRPYPNVVHVDFIYFEKRVSGPQSHMVIVSMKVDDGSYRGGSYENFLSSKYELARGALVNALKLLPRDDDK